MRLIGAVLVILAVWLVISWVRDTQQEQQEKLSQQPRSANYITRNIDQGRQSTAAIQLEEYKRAMQMYRLNKGRSPASLRELVEENYLMAGAEFDPFGQPYDLQYESGEAVLRSPGVDKVRGTPDDIVNRFRIE